MRIRSESFYEAVPSVPSAGMTFPSTLDITYLLMAARTGGGDCQARSHARSPSLIRRGWAGSAYN